MELTEEGWKIMEPKPELKPSSIFALNKDAIWLISTTEYQDSKLAFLQRCEVGRFL